MRGGEKAEDNQVHNTKTWIEERNRKTVKEESGSNKR